MSTLRIIFFTLVLALLLSAQISIGGQDTPSVDSDSQNAYEDIELFTDVLAIINNSYVEDVNIRTLVYGAIRGMVATLDPHSSFLTPELYEEMQADTHGEFGGIGIEVTLTDGTLAVVSPIEGTPAQRAGIRARDKIVRINGRPTQNLDLMEAVKIMRGAVGEKISLGIRRDGVEKLLEFTLVREVIQVHSVSGETLQPGFAYVRITQFQEKTGHDLKAMLSKLRIENQDALKGLIVDLRNNPGGLLEQAVEVTDLFLKEGLIVYTEGRVKTNQLRFEASAEGTEPAYPLVLLINEGSASASEIVAGALRDHGRALLLGERTFGKGSVQTIIPLSDHSGLRLTTAKYFTPQGISIQARGIAPDIEVSALELPQDQANKSHYREKDLENHFSASEELETETDKISIDSEKRSDFQLMRALDLLNGLEYLNQSGIGKETNPEL